MNLALEAFNTIRHFTDRGWGRTHCPFCSKRKGSKDARLSFAVNNASGFYHCFRCLAKGWLQGDTFKVNLDVKTTPKVDDFPWPESYVPLRDGMGSMEYAHYMDYLSGRGIGADIIDACGIGACGGGRFRNRVIVPLFSANNKKLLGYSARLLPQFVKPDSVKYLYPKDMARDSTVFNEGAIEAKSETPLIIVEGVFDALPYYPHAVAVLGKPSKGQFRKIRQTKRKVAVVLDGDAWKEGQMFAKKLELFGVDAKSIRLEPLEDPGDCDPDKLVKDVKSLFN